MAIVDVSNRPWVVEIVPDNVVAEFTDASTTVEVPNGTPLVEFRCCESGGGGAGGALQFQDEGINLGANDSDTLNFVGGLVEATRTGNTVTATIAAASNAETNAGVLATKGVTPESGAYAYDRLHFPGQHDAGKATECITLTPVAGVVTIDALLSNVFRIVLTQNVTFAKPINLLLGQVLKLTIEQDDVGGWTGTFHPDIKFPFGLDPVVSTAPNAMDLVSVLHDEATGLLLGSYMPDYTGTGTGWGIMVPGPPGPAGPPGAPGSVGPTGPAGTPAGGLTGQVLMKTTDDDYDADWASIGGLTLSGLGDVDVTGLIDGQALIWDSTLSEWVPGAAGDVATDAIWDAKGDLAVGSALDTAVRLPVGTDGQVLAANSAEATGLEWIDPPAGTGGGLGGSMGALAYVGESVSSSASAVITSPTLDLDSDELYYFEVTALNALGTAPTAAFSFNSDTTASNYARVRAIFDAGASSTRANDNGLHSLSASDAYGMRGYISRGADGRVRCTYSGDRGESSGDITTASGMIVWSTLATNVTSFSITGSTASCFATGATIRVWKLGVAGVDSACVVARIALQNFSTTAQAVSWDTEEYDTDGYFDAVNPTRITFPTAGWYTVIGTVWQSIDADDMQTLWFAKNGAAYSVTQTQTRMGAGSTAVAAGTNLTETTYYAAGDYIELYVDNRSGTSSAYARMSVIRHGGPTGGQGPQGVQGVAGSKGNLYYATTDEVRSSTTTLADDPILQTPLEANKRYRLEFDVYWDSSTAPDLKVDLNFTGVATSCLSNWLYGQLTTASLPTGASTSTFSYWTASALNAVRTFTWGGTDTQAAKIVVNIEVGATGGIFSLRWAQGTSSGTATTRRRDSTLLVTEANTSLNIDTEVAADTPVGYWKFDEASGNLVDSSGNGHTLTIVGSPVAKYAYTALDPKNMTRKTLAAFGAGVGDHATSGDLLGLTAPILTWTLEAWGAFTSPGVIIGIGANGETSALNFAGQLEILTGGTLDTFWEYGSGTNAPVATSYLGGALTGKLVHCAITKDATTREVKFYINGRLAGDLTYTSGQEHTGGGSGVFSVMGSPGDSTDAPNGIYSGAAMYSNVLTEARIQAHAAALGVYP